MFGERILKDWDHIEQDLATLVAIPSVKGEEQLGKPFGEESARALEFVLQRARELGLSAENTGNYAGHASWGSGAEYDAVLTHVDVVPAGSGWKTDPFTLTAQDGLWYGRGITDDKGSAIVALYCLKALKDAGVTGKREMRVIFGAGEEHGMLAFSQMGIPTFDYGNNIRQMAKEMGVSNAFDFPGFVPAYIRPLFCRGIGPFRWVALSGDPEDIYKTDAKVKEIVADDEHLHHWLDMARERINFQGLPARICWVGLEWRQKLGLAFNEMVRSGEVSAPIVIGRDHLDSGSVASPNRETEAMRDGSDAVSDWPLLNALLNTASGATWVSLHHGGGVGMGFSQHSGMVIVCDGTDEAAARIARVLHNDPATGVMRHADAGYEIAIECAKEQGLNLPMIPATQGKH